MNIPVSTEVAVVTGTVTLTAIGQLKPLKDEPFAVKSVLITAGDANTGTVLVGYGAGAARTITLPKTFPAVDGKWYDLNKFIAASTAAGDTVLFEAVR